MDLFVRNAEAISLSGDDILAICKGRTRIVRYDALQNYTDISQIFKNDSFVLHYPTTTRNSGHWVAVIYHRDSRVIEFYDSYGLKYDDEIKLSEYLQQHPESGLYAMTHLLEHAKRVYGVRVIYNNQRNQRIFENVNTCGRHVAMRIRMRHLPLAKYNQLMTGGDADRLVTLLTVMFSDSAESLVV